MWCPTHGYVMQLMTDSGQITVYRKNLSILKPEPLLLDAGYLLADLVPAHTPWLNVIAEHLMTCDSFWPCSRLVDLVEDRLGSLKGSECSSQTSPHRQ